MFVPADRTSSRTAARAPVPSAAMVITEATPITNPTSASPVRSGFARSAAAAVRNGRGASTGAESMGGRPVSPRGLPGGRADGAAPPTPPGILLSSSCGCSGSSRS